MGNNQNAQTTILIVDDEEEVINALRRDLRRLDLQILTSTDPNHALEILKSVPVEIVIVDRVMSPINGEQLLENIAQLYPETVRVMMTGQTDPTALISIINKGKISSYISKPWDKTQLVSTIKQAICHAALLAERSVLKYSLRQQQRKHGLVDSSLIGDSKLMLDLKENIAIVAPSDVSIFIEGESGTGKELIANALHKQSKRFDNPLIALNCAAIPSELMESEIFGHVKGAFSGAYENRLGAASLANNGTLFLDEIGEMDILLQAKLLRFLQTGEFRKVGSNKIEKVNIRIISATNRSPLRAIKEGKLREDLYYRLNVVNLTVPRLVERRSDIIKLANHFLDKYASHEQKKVLGFTDIAAKYLINHSWHGNVRELENVIRATVLFADGHLVTEQLLLRVTQSSVCASCGGSVTTTEDSNNVNDQPSAHSTETIEPLVDTERKAIEHAIKVCGDNVVKASEQLQVSPSTLYRKLQAWENS